MNALTVDLSNLDLKFLNFQNIDSIEESIEAETLVSPTYIKLKKKTKDDLFFDEIKKLPFGDDIIKEAYDIYLRMTLSIKRKNNRVYLKFFCIYNAHLKLNKIKDVKHLARTMGIDPAELNKVFKMFSYENTEYQISESVDLTPLNYLTYYYKFTELRMDEVERVCAFGEEIIKRQDFEGEFPQAVAIAIIIYYVRVMNNMSLPEKFFNTIGYSKPMINKIVNQIGAVYNS